jgi:hypothetical protein
MQMKLYHVSSSTQDPEKRKSRKLRNSTDKFHLHLCFIQSPRKLRNLRKSSKSTATSISFNDRGNQANQGI